MPPSPEILAAYGSYINSVRFSPDGKSLAFATGDGHLVLWGVQSRAKLSDTDTEQSISYCVGFSPDGRLLATGGSGRAVSWWDRSTMKQLGQPLDVYKGPVRALAFSPNGSLLATAGEDGKIALWDVAARKVRLGPFLGGGEVYSLAFSPDSKTLYSAGKDGLVHIWNAATGHQARRAT